MSNLASIAFSSDLACTSIAERIIRETRQTQFIASPAVHDAVRPILRTMVRHGKLDRHQVAPWFAQLLAGLHGMDNLIVVGHACPSVSRLSAKHEGVVWFITRYVPYRAWLGFMAYQVTLTRHALTIECAPVHFLLKDHLLMRWMRRQQTDPQHLMTTIVPTMQVAVVLSAVAATRDQMTPLAVPFGGGLLLGHGLLLADVKRKRRRLDRRGEHNEHLPAGSAIGTDRPATALRTFIDEASLNPAKQELAEAVADYAARHATGLTSVFAGHCFGTAWLEQQPATRDRAAQAAVAEAEALITTPAWHAVTAPFAGEAGEADAPAPVFPAFAA